MSPREKKGAAAGRSTAPRLTGTAKHRYNNPRAQGNTTPTPSKENFSGKTKGMNSKVFDVGVKQTKQFIDTHIELAKFVARENKNGH